MDVHQPSAKQAELKMGKTSAHKNFFEIEDIE